MSKRLSNLLETKTNLEIHKFADYQPHANSKILHGSHPINAHSKYSKTPWKALFLASVFFLERNKIEK